MTCHDSSMPLKDASQQAPLVTFALFAYNQEKFIREAIEGAFAQTYEPLEIILSDDCSMDRTFAIMQEMAAAYRGPHRVRAVQTPHNLGVVQHMLLRGREAAGDIVVVAAGDDISLPERVARHVPCYADPKVWAVSTGFQLIDEYGQPVDESASIIGERITQRVRLGEPTYLRVMPDDYTTIQGSTASYRRLVFDLLPAAEEKEIRFAEDQLFTFLIHAIGHRIDYLQQALVYYRIHSNALSNRPRRGFNWRDDELKSALNLDSEIEKLQFYLQFTCAHGLETVVDVSALQEKLAALQEQKSWPDLSIAARVVSVVRDALRGNTHWLKWKIARLWGQSPDYWPKRALASYQRKYRTY